VKYGGAGCSLVEYSILKKAFSSSPQHATELTKIKHWRDKAATII